MITTHGRKGTFVSSDVLARTTRPDASLAEEYVATARRQGLTLPEALALVERAWPR